jgi:calcium-translocating P-type ATPase
VSDARVTLVPTMPNGLTGPSGLTGPRSLTGPSGLTGDEAAARLREDGPNELEAPRRASIARQIAAQMVHFFALLLWAAGALAIVAGMPQLGIAIFVVVVVNGCFALLQELRAEHAAERLADLLPRRAVVVRDGVTREIAARELVTGDVVVLRAGDRICADLEAGPVNSLRVDVSMLTGESVPVDITSADRLFAGTFVVEGDGTARVVATGTSTALAGIARLTHEVRRPPSPLTLEIRRVVRVVALIAGAVGSLCFVAAVGLGMRANDGFLIAIGVMVALVPEGLLPTMTLSLAVGAQRMAGRHALVRHLEAVETLGSTTFVCTDKTGTLTMNQMSVVEVWTPAGRAAVHGSGYAPDGAIEAAHSSAAAVRRAAAAAERCSTGRAAFERDHWRAQGDPMEAAIWTLARRAGVAEVAPDVARRFPFDTARRRMSVATGDEVIVKGAPDAVLPLCRGDNAGAVAALEDLAARGLRVLAVAARPLDEVPETAGGAERDLTLLALFGFEDPPRPSAAGALRACRAAGVRVAMITGDHPTTAEAIAREVGLADAREHAMVGADLPENLDMLGALIDRDGVIVARVDPEQKLRIAQALQRRGHVVAMTGDGVNDGPALREADVGVAMGRSGSDVAREAADLLLLDDEFATIVAAIRQGRATFTNIRRFLTYHLTDNVAELTPFVVWALSGGRFPLAIGVLQVLMLDIGTDLLPALALGAEAPAPSDDGAAPPRGHLIDRKLLRRVFGRLGPAEAGVEMSAFLASLVASGWRPGEPFFDDHRLLVASGAAFSAVVIAQCANAFACRSEHEWAFARGRPANRLLIGAVIVELALLVIVLTFAPFADLLDHAPPSVAGLGVALLAAPAVVAVDWIDKSRRARSGIERSVA